MNVFDPIFTLKAKVVTGVEWDFSRLLDNSHQCCIQGCFRGREYGYWTCTLSEHRLLELEHFDHKTDLGHTFWTQFDKKNEIKRLRREVKTK